MPRAAGRFAQILRARGRVNARMDILTKRDKRYDVIVAMDVRAHKYLKTDADRDQPDELLLLPTCHHVVHTSYAVPGRTLAAGA